MLPALLVLLAAVAACAIAAPVVSAQDAAAVLAAPDGAAEAAVPAATEAPEGSVAEPASGTTPGDGARGRGSAAG